MKKCVLIIIMTLLVSHCGNTPKERAISGAGIGAGVGAATSAVTGGHVLTGAVVGAGVGAVTGAVTDKNDIDLGD